MFILFLYLVTLLTIIPTHIYSAQATSSSRWSEENNDLLALQSAITKRDLTLIRKIFKNSKTPLSLANRIKKNILPTDDRELNQELAKHTKVLSSATTEFEARSTFDIRTFGFLEFEGVILDPLVGLDGRPLDKHGHLLG